MIKITILALFVSSSLNATTLDKARILAIIKAAKQGNPTSKGMNANLETTPKTPLKTVSPYGTLPSLVPYGRILKERFAKKHKKQTKKPTSLRTLKQAHINKTTFTKIEFY